MVELLLASCQGFVRGQNLEKLGRVNFRVYMGPPLTRVQFENNIGREIHEMLRGQFEGPLRAVVSDI